MKPACLTMKVCKMKQTPSYEYMALLVVSTIVILGAIFTAILSAIIGVGWDWAWFSGFFFFGAFSQFVLTMKYRKDFEG